MKRTNAQLEELIQSHMNTLGCTREEAIDLIECDDEIDRGNTELFALTPEQKKTIRALTKADRDPEKVTTRKPRERKVDSAKHTVYGWIFHLMRGMQSNDLISDLAVKEDAELSFMHEGAEFTIKIVKHRPKK